MGNYQYELDCRVDGYYITPRRQVMALRKQRVIHNLPDIVLKKSGLRINVDPIAPGFAKLWQKRNANAP